MKKRQLPGDWKRLNQTFLQVAPVGAQQNVLAASTGPFWPPQGRCWGRAMHGPWPCPRELKCHQRRALGESVGTRKHKENLWLIKIIWGKWHKNRTKLVEALRTVVFFLSGLERHRGCLQGEQSPGAGGRHLVVGRKPARGHLLLGRICFHVSLVDF